MSILTIPTSSISYIIIPLVEREIIGNAEPVLMNSKVGTTIGRNEQQFEGPRNQNHENDRSCFHVCR